MKQFPTNGRYFSNRLSDISTPATNSQVADYMLRQFKESASTAFLSHLDKITDVSCVYHIYINIWFQLQESHR